MDANKNSTVTLLLLTISVSLLCVFSSPVEQKISPKLGRSIEKLLTNAPTSPTGFDPKNMIITTNQPTIIPTSHVPFEDYQWHSLLGAERLFQEAAFLDQSEQKPTVQMVDFGKVYIVKISPVWTSFKFTFKFTSKNHLDIHIKTSFNEYHEDIEFPFAVDKARFDAKFEEEVNTLFLVLPKIITLPASSSSSSPSSSTSSPSSSSSSSSSSELLSTPHQMLNQLLQTATSQKKLATKLTTPQTTTSDSPSALRQVEQEGPGRDASIRPTNVNVKHPSSAPSSSASASSSSVPASASSKVPSPSSSSSSSTSSSSSSSSSTQPVGTKAPSKTSPSSQPSSSQPSSQTLSDIHARLRNFYSLKQQQQQQQQQQQATEQQQQPKQQQHKKKQQQHQERNG